jgi:UrcA family protein
MRHFTPIAAAAFAAGLCSQASAAAEYIVEAPALQQIVPVTAADLLSANPTVALEQRIRAAAKSVCNKQYRDESLYRVVHLCVSGSTADGLRQFSDLRARQAVAAASARSSLVLVISPAAE